MDWQVKGRAALVTGASAGIGAAMVRALVAAGVRVVATARRGDRLFALRDELGSDRVCAVVADIADPVGRATLVRDATAAFGPITLLVNNAGYGQRGPIELVPEREARRQFDVNVFGLTELTRALLPAMRAAGSGRILMVSSVVGRVAVPISGWYAATKHALEALSDAMRLELAGFGIHVVLIEPGPVITEFDEVAKQTYEHLEGDVAGYRSLMDQVQAKRATALTGWITADECARQMMVATTVARPGARYPITRLAWQMILMRWLLPQRLLDAVFRWRLGLPAFGSQRAPVQKS